MSQGFIYGHFICQVLLRRLPDTVFKSVTPETPETGSVSGHEELKEELDIGEKTICIKINLY